MISLYLEQTSYLHRMPAGIKLLAMAGLSLALYPIEQLSLLLVLAMLTLLIYASLGRPAMRGLKVFRSLVPIFALIFIMQAWSVGVYEAFALLLRMATLVLIANLITLTTKMDDMMTAMMPIFRPLRLFGVDPKRIAFAVTLLIRFIPVLMGVTQYLLEAWKSRGGGRQLWKLAIPLTIQSIRLSDHVAEALASRGGIRSVKKP
ncbi:energy-coupling factor transporter transmembrane component T family protein [Nitrincola alkalisediminis]|uniref:energy-coupling factor transporter transmembrane component T family protein n=1 Tax=Nitrincola alkalisediminis TaxID=1366656 RepID=UPI001875B3AD|nr:energy-coupling factor transporter transmembrane component T [Nitrincola alkalisediminis]